MVAPMQVSSPRPVRAPCRVGYLAEGGQLGGQPREQEQILGWPHRGRSLRTRSWTTACLWQRPPTIKQTPGSTSHNAPQGAALRDRNRERAAAFLPRPYGFEAFDSISAWGGAHAKGRRGGAAPVHL